MNPSNIDAFEIPEVFVQMEEATAIFFLSSIQPDLSGSATIIKSVILTFCYRIMCTTKMTSITFPHLIFAKLTCTLNVIFSVVSLITLLLL